MKLAADPDLHVPKLLEQGFPVGIREPILPSGLLPVVKEEASMTPEALEDTVRLESNHKSFDELEGEGRPAHRLLADLVDQGFAFLLRDRADAERWLGALVVVSPLGDVTKPKADGSTKHRLIMDLRASSVNEASAVSERQVLPRFGDHARDVAISSELSSDMGVFILEDGL